MVKKVVDESLNDLREAGVTKLLRWMQRSDLHKARGREDRRGGGDVDQSSNAWSYTG